MPKSAKITKDMPIGKVIGKFPRSALVFIEHGFHCVGCPASQSETVEEGAQLHRINLQKLLEDLNKTAAE